MSQANPRPESARITGGGEQGTRQRLQAAAAAVKTALDNLSDQYSPAVVKAINDAEYELGRATWQYAQAIRTDVDPDYLEEGQS